MKKRSHPYDPQQLRIAYVGESAIGRLDYDRAPISAGRSCVNDGQLDTDGDMFLDRGTAL
jgi:hypothetical protein